MKIAKKIKKENDSYKIDFIKCYKGNRFHIYKSNIDSYEEARKLIPLLINKKINEYESTRFKNSFDEFIKFYLDYRSSKISKATLIWIKTAKGKYMNTFTDLSIDEAFGVFNISKWHKYIREIEDISPKYKNRIIGEMKLMIDYAIKLCLISSEDAMSSINLLEPVKLDHIQKEKQIYTKEELDKFLSVIDDPFDKDMFLVFSYLGLRISEFIGLTRDCYDKENETIEVKQQILYEQEQKPVLVHTLKTKESYRKCKLSKKINEILLKRSKECNKGFIFYNTRKTVYDSFPKTRFRELIVKYALKAGLPPISPHGFRHTKATILMSVCLSMSDVKAAAKFMGHSVTMMMETYAHEDKEAMNKMIERLEEK